jgi:hypothetical protein
MRRKQETSSRGDDEPVFQVCRLSHTRTHIHTSSSEVKTNNPTASTWFFQRQSSLEGVVEEWIGGDDGGVGGIISPRPSLKEVKSPTTRGSQEEPV